ncbi:hypothetical protein ACFMQL_17400 [Nonomuraea fastidiosa]|uniref:hypothetical protein n=1 Tax=Nonomuraea TaxID=83681 RepID=UPI003251FAD5
MSLAATAAFVATSTIPGQAESSLVMKYHCTGGIAGAGVDLEARMTPQIESGTMNVRWDMKYTSVQRFGSPGFFPEGSSLDLEGTVDVSGAWVGQLRPRGGQPQGELVPGDFLDLPEGLSDNASITRAGNIRFKPGKLTVRFTPAEGEAMVNNSESEVTYTGTWRSRYTGNEYDDYKHDINVTREKDATARLDFVGTQVAYIGRREKDLGPVRVLIDGQHVTDGLVEPGKDRSGNPMTGTETQQVLWTSPPLKYGPHWIEVINTEDKRAYVDAFQVTTSGISEPPEYGEATCELQGDPGAIDVNVPGPTTDPTDDPTEDPTEDPTDEPTDPGEDPNDPNDPGQDGDNNDVGTIGEHVRVVPQASSSTSSSPTSTGPTATKYYRAQVAKTPSGGVETGVAPDEDDRPPYGLMATGMVVVAGSAGGGLLLRRRRAAHAGGA